MVRADPRVCPAGCLRGRADEKKSAKMRGYGIVSSEGEQDYMGAMAMSGRLSVTDVRGETR